MLRHTFQEIDLEGLKHNVRELGRFAKGKLRMAIVKADAYGHGAKECATAAIEAGADWLGVATPEEAEDLVFLGKPILILSPVGKEATKDSVRLGISLCAFTKDHIKTASEMAKKAGKKAKLHIKCDTGMGRIGIRSEQELMEVLACADENVEIEGIFTHFSTADEADLRYTEKQLEAFRRYIAIVNRMGFHPIVHAANSAAILGLPDAHFDMVRMGVAMYGYFPAADFDKKDADLRPVMSVKSCISHIKEVDIGESISYGRHFIAKRKSLIATVPIGYADGYMRANSNKAFVLAKGKRVPVCGNVCMDQIMLDITDVPDLSIGDEVVLMGRQGSECITADELAAYAGTISYEILTSFKGRMPRIYEHGR
ncbi:MAG: alanine racemase [Clostridiales bacterium]|nr:alanine racemase [Clostridiales bacterium]